MNWHRILIAGVSAFIVGCLLGFAYLATAKIYNPLNQSVAMSLSANNEEMIVTKDTILRTKNIYLCGEEEDLGEESRVAALKGMNHQDLQQIFSPEDGWHVKFASSNELVLGRMVGELCEMHQQYRHLGIYQDKLAVFQGPLGLDTILMQVHQRPVENLPQSMQEKLTQAMDFNNLPLETQEQLKIELEFINERKLNAVLENLDEHH